MINTGNMQFAPTYTLDYGDGTIETPVQCYAPTDFCINPGVNKHTYTSAGTYVAKLMKADASPCQYSANFSCTADYRAVQIASVSVTVNGTMGNSSFTATPTSGASPLTVSFSTMVNPGNMPYPPQYTINYGDGTSEKPVSCYAPTDFCISPGVNKHTYTSPGTYTAVLTKVGDAACLHTNPRCMMAQVIETVGTVTITVSGGRSCGLPPVVACFSPYVPASQGTDSYGCPLPPKCVIPPKNCPLYNAPNCPTGVSFDQGYNSIGCKLPPVCTTL
jgi:hypothetical protein